MKRMSDLRGADAYRTSRWVSPNCWSMADNKTGTDFLAAILHHGLAVAVVEHEMAALAALPVDPNRHAPLAPDGHHTVDELAPLHGSRTE